MRMFAGRQTLLERWILLVAIASTALGQCAVQGTATVGANYSQITSCPTFSGSIALATDAPSTVDLGNISVINGDLSINQAHQLEELHASSLWNISGYLRLIELSSLSTIEMSNLSNVGHGSSGGIEWQSLPLLQNLNFGSGISLASVAELNETGARDLSPLNISSVGLVKLFNNSALTTVDWALNKVGNIYIGGNGLSIGGTNFTFDNVPSLSNLSLVNVSSISMDQLTTASNIKLDAGTFANLSFPKLSDASFVVSNCANLESINFNALEQCQGDLDLIDNPLLNGAISFPELKAIYGNLNITGNFSSVDMPQLSEIDGSSTLLSSQDIQSTCALFGPNNTSVKGSVTGPRIQGNAVCQGSIAGTAATVSADSASGTTASAEGHTFPMQTNSIPTIPPTPTPMVLANDDQDTVTPANLPTASIAGIVVGAGAAAVTIISGIAWLTWRRRKRRRAGKFSELKENEPEPRQRPELRTLEISKSETSSEGAPTEISASTAISEAPDTHADPFELPAGNGIHEMMGSKWL